jgi:hypothetical protein
MSDTANRAFVLSVLVLVLAATRVNHFAAIPDASWAVFFIGGFYLAGWTRWAFPLLMVFAVLVDWIVIRSSGLDFWQHYCVSPGYWLLLPAYFSLWAGGMLLGRNYQGARWPVLAKGALLLVASVAVCHLLAQGGSTGPAATWPSRRWPAGHRTTRSGSGLPAHHRDLRGAGAALQLAVEQVLKLQQARRDIRH